MATTMKLATIVMSESSTNMMTFSTRIQLKSALFREIRNCPEFLIEVSNQLGCLGMFYGRQIDTDIVLEMERP